MLNIFEDYCDMRGYQYSRFDGSTDLDERQAMIEEFGFAVKIQVKSDASAAIGIAK